MQTISDNTIIDKLKSEDNSSFELLYKFYFPSVATYIKQNLGNHEDAEDIFQEAIIVLLQKVRQPEFELTSSLKTYLYAIAKNLWLKKLRDNKIKITDGEFDLINHSTDSFELEPEKSKEEKVENWLQKITRNCQAVLKALFFYGEPMDKLMVKMGWKNKHSASNQKHKCIQQIKNVKEKED
jgi:RNA polymerase sigma factor (sigma-70 family)